MRLFVNGVEREVSCSADDTLQSFLERLGGEALARGETILRVTVDGDDHSQVVARSGAVRVGDVGELGVTIAGLRDLTEDSLAEAVAYVPRLSRGLADAALALQRGAVVEGSDLLLQALDGLEWLYQLLSGLARLSELGKAPWIDPDDAERLRAWSRDLAQGLDGCRQAMEAQDPILLADRLEYDLAGRLSSLPAEMEELRAKAARGS